MYIYSYAFVERIVQNFDKENFDKLIVGFIGETKISRENFDEMLVIHQSFPLLNFNSHYTVYNSIIYKYTRSIASIDTFLLFSLVENECTLLCSHIMYSYNRYVQ